MKKLQQSVWNFLLDRFAGIASAPPRATILLMPVLTGMNQT